MAITETGTGIKEFYILKYKETNDPAAYFLVDENGVRVSRNIEELGRLEGCLDKSQIGAVVRYDIPDDVLKRTREHYSFHINKMIMPLNEDEVLEMLGGRK